LRKKSFLPVRLSAYTLLEMLIVLTIIGILLTAGLATYSTVQNTAMKKAAQIELRQYQIAIQTFKVDSNTLPSSSKELLEKGYITKELLTDPWNTEYRIENTSENTIKIISAGPDRRFGTKDDITEETTVF